MSKSNESRVAVVLYGPEAAEFLRIKAEVEARAQVEVTERHLVLAALRAWAKRITAEAR